MKVSLVTTVKDAAGDIGEFLTSLRAQTRPPDEVIVVDGGSTDGTLEALRAAPDVTVIEEPGANISRGRNIGIRAAIHDVIAVTDADCVLSPDWLRHLVEMIDDGADVAMGFYRPITRSFFEACSAAVSLPEEEEVDPHRFMPSSRSVAFRREAYDLAGGYPEWLDVGEDMHLDHRFRELALEMRFVPRALVFWRVRPTIGATWRQYFGYARGDAIAGLHPTRHALRFAVYGGALWAAATGRRGLLRALGIAAGAYAVPRIRRAWRLLPGRPAERAAAVAAVPALMVLADVAKMAGYLNGRRQPGGTPSP